MKNEEKLLSVAEFVDRSGLAERTVRQLISDGRLRVVRPFNLRRVFIPESVLRDLVRATEE